MQKLTLEYPLNARSPKIVWDMISNAAGLQKWIADVVTEDGDTMTFTWGNPWTERDTKQSRILNKEKFKAEPNVLYDKTMKKMKLWSILMFMVMALPMNAWGQNTKPKKTVYCQIYADWRHMKASITHFYGGVNYDKVSHRYICNENNEPVMFDNIIEIFNYISDKGWVYVERLGNLDAGSDIYLFKKEADNAEEAYKSLNALTKEELKEKKK